MSMNPLSRIVETLKHGAILDVAIEELQFRAYIVISEPDIERVADFVPKEQFEQDGDVHVAAISHPGQAREQIQDIAFKIGRAHSELKSLRTIPYATLLLTKHN